jgi:hypothetical protein
MELLAASAACCQALIACWISTAASACVLPNAKQPGRSRAIAMKPSSSSPGNISIGYRAGSATFSVPHFWLGASPSSVLNRSFSKSQYFSINKRCSPIRPSKRASPIWAARVMQAHLPSSASSLRMKRTNAAR